MKEGQTPSRVYLNERLYEKKVETVARAKSAGACYMLVPAGRVKVFFFFFEKIGPAGRVILLWRVEEKGLSPF